MISIELNIVETNESDGSRNAIVVSSLLSGDKFDVDGGTTVKRIKMSGSSVIKISDLVELMAVSSIVITTKSDDDKVFPLFDMSVIGDSGYITATHRGSMYAIAGVQGLMNDLQIDNMEDRGGNAEMKIVITIST